MNITTFDDLSIHQLSLDCLELQLHGDRSWRIPRGILAWVGNRWPKPHRGDMMEEGFEIFRRLATEKESSFDGKYCSYKDIERFPKSEQNPFPLYVDGHNLKAVERAAEIGRGWDRQSGRIATIDH